MRDRSVLIVSCLLAVTRTATAAEHPFAAPRVTSLTNPGVRFQTPAEHCVVLQRGDVRAAIVDNAEVKHRQSLR